MVIDIHTHAVPATFPASLRADVKGWPSMEPAGDCHRNIVIDGEVYRKLSDQCWDTSKRIADMDSRGVTLQAVSPMPELFSYWMDASSADILLRYVNDQIAEFVAAAKGRMVGLAAVPLQQLDLAILELHRTRKIGFAGVEIGSNVNGKPIGSPDFDPFFAEAEKIGAAVFVHAVRPLGAEMLVGPKPLMQALGYPTDVGLAAASVITSNLLTRYPRLRIAFSHGGGTLPSLLPRLAEAYRVFPAIRQQIAEEPLVQARKLFFDGLVYDTATLKHLITLFGEKRIIIGTDYPFTFHDREPVARVHRVTSNPEVEANLLFRNAQRFLHGDGGEV